MTPATLPSRFAAKTMAATCTVWIGATNSKGYGLIAVNGRIELAHRVAWEAENGPIPDGMVIDHLCRVRNCVRVSHLDCVRVSHLELVTSAENTRRGRAVVALRVGEACTNGHEIQSEADLYRRATGAVECRVCRRAQRRSHSETRPTRQRRAEGVRADLMVVDESGAVS